MIKLRQVKYEESRYVGGPRYGFWVNAPSEPGDPLYLDPNAIDVVQPTTHGYVTRIYVNGSTTFEVWGTVEEIVRTIEGGYVVEQA